MIDLEKLAAQSLVYADTGLDDGKELIFSKEKFAELIVRECAELVETQHTWITSAAASALIRKHFGIEE